MFKNVVFGLSVVAGLLMGGSAVSADQYVVKSGDTVSSIALNNGVTIDDIVSANGIADANVIYAGDVLNIEAAQTVAVDSTVMKNDNEVVLDVQPVQNETVSDQAAQPVQSEVVSDTQEVAAQPAQNLDTQDVQDTPAIAANDIVSYNGVDDKGVKFDDGDDSNDQYYVNSVTDWGYGHTEDNSDKNVTTPVLTVPAPDQFITPQHTTFNSSEAQPIAGDSSLDGSKVFNGSDWVLK